MKTRKKLRKMRRYLPWEIPTLRKSVSLPRKRNMLLMRFSFVIPVLRKCRDGSNGQDFSSLCPMCHA